MPNSSDEESRDEWLSGVYLRIQDLFVNGLVTVVGSGASCGYNLPGMAALATAIQNQMPELIEQLADADEIAAMQQISDSLAGGESLEAALSVEHSAEVRRLLRQSVGTLIASAEREAFQRLLRNPSEAVYIRLFELILKKNSVADVITTNYDRLIEFSAALGDQRVDTMFYGQTLGRLDRARAQSELHDDPRPAQGRSRQRLTRKPGPRIRLAKPHGSLDWREIDGAVYRTEVVDDAPHIIAPSSNKFREGYGVGFQEHIARSTEAITNATSFLFIGFGFNDEHLQTHLTPRLRQTPSVVITHALTESARSILSQSPSMVAVEAKGEGATVHFNGRIVDVEQPLWNLDTLLAHVLSSPRTQS